MTQPAVSPYVPFYAELQPYITVAEFLAAPTGVDTTQLVPGGNPDQNRAALTTVIASASNYADSLCYQVLAATTDLQVGEYRVTRDGLILVPLDFSPVIAVSSVSLGYQAGSLQPLTDLTGLWIDRKVVRVPVSGLSAYSGAYSRANGAASARAGWVFARVGYVNGYANTSLAVAATAGASSVQLASGVGVFPGMPLTIYDDLAATTEPVVVASTYTLGSTTVPLVSPLVSNHAAGVAVSALPRAVKQAVIALTAHLIKTRGAEALALSGVSGGPASVQQVEPGGSEEYEQAVDLLHPFRRVI